MPSRGRVVVVLKREERNWIQEDRNSKQNVGEGGENRFACL